MGKKILAILIGLCVLSAAVPVYAASGRGAYAITLEYDDRYSIDEFKSGYVVVAISDEEAESYIVEDGTVTSSLDTSVISLADASNTELIADGVGTAIVTIAPKRCAGVRSRWINIKVTVEPAALSVLFLAGQSNALGGCSSNMGYELAESVACEPGTVYSTYLPCSLQTDENITGIEFSEICYASNAAGYVAASLSSGLSYSGTALEYPLNTLTEDGNGKTGPDSALAWEWNRLTGDKVWIVNTAWSNTSIYYWQKGRTCYDRMAAVYDLVMQTYEAEIAAGHYTAGDILLFWLQGEKDYEWSVESYSACFANLCDDINNDFDFEAIGIISPRAAQGQPSNSADIVMTAPRIVQYLASNSSSYSNVYIVSNANEEWTSDEGVEAYFEEAYPEGYITYPRHDEASKYFDSLPSAVSEIHNDNHYSQTGHNENGITAADGMYEILYGSTEISSLEWVNGSGFSVTSLTIGVGETAVLIPAAQPACSGKGITVATLGRSVSYDADTGTVSGVKKGVAYIYAYIGDELISAIKITITSSTKNGLYYSSDIGWAYYINDIIDINYYGIAEDDDGTIAYISGGYIDSDYTAFTSYGGTWYYLVDGIIAYDYTGLVRNDYGWWYVTEGCLDLTYTGMAKNAYGWWYVENGKLDADYTGMASNDYGTWYFSGGRINSSFTGLVTFDGITYYITNGWVNIYFTGTLAGKNGTYYVIENGIVVDIY